MISLSEIKRKSDPGYTMTADTVDMGRRLDRNTVWEQFMESYSVYYNVTRHDVNADRRGDFDAEAVFDSKSEQYFLVRAAKVAEMNTAEYVYFANMDRLTADTLSELDIKAWEKGISQVKPSASHKNTDVVLIIIADRIDPEAMQLVRKLRHSKNYRFALHGYSNYRLVAVGCDEGQVCFNRQARVLRTLVGNILKDEKERGK